MPVHAPITLAAHVGWRAAVLDFREGEPRRHPPLSIHLGSPGVSSARYVVGPGQRLDPALRADLAAALLQRARRDDPRPVAWLTRDGGPGAHDADLAWLFATRTAFAEAALPATFVVVTRVGWRDPVTGVGRQWRRLRRYHPRVGP